MALCLADSLVASGGFDAADQMDRYVRWWREGYLSSNGECFDIGITVSDALEPLPTHRRTLRRLHRPRTSAGNGSLMRLAPAPAVLRAGPGARNPYERRKLPHYSRG